MPSDRIKSYVGAAALAVGALLPLLALLPFGWLWLWQNGYTLYWLAGALIVSLLAFGVRAWLLRRLGRTLAEGETRRLAEQDSLAQTTRAPREIAAWQAVETLAANVDPAKITDREQLIGLGIETVEAVARQMHPEVEEPLWNFTIPEALILIERVSQRLRPLVIGSIPLGDRLTVGQVMRIYEWRGLIDVANRAYDVWRLIRLLNPVAATTQEIRERLSKSMYDGLREALAKRLAAAYVREIGGAAVDLYSGRLRTLDFANADGGAGQPGATKSAAPKPDELPLRLLIAGRTGGGKSSLVNALAEQVQAPVDALPQTLAFTDYEVQRPGMPAVVLIDSPGIGTPGESVEIAVRAADCDVLVWVVGADRPDRELDRASLEAVRAYFNQRRDLRSPPILLVLTHIDRLRPFREWSPPYDIAGSTSPKALSIRAAMDAASSELSVPVQAMVPVCLSIERGVYNADLVWAALIAVLPAAKSTQLLRRIAESRSGLDWQRLLVQAAGAGRVVIDVLKRGRPL